MASAELRDELNCSICLSLYTDPVSLRCGHNFCRSCIIKVLDTQDSSGGYTCPDCREKYSQRPALQKNRKLGNIVDCVLSTKPDMEETGIFCSYCIKSPVPAVKSCLQCENSLCGDHLTAHNKTMDHILTKPTDSFDNKKCSIHKKVLEYYCPQDIACLCVSCCLVGKHRGHQVELLHEASEKKQKKLCKYLSKLNPQKAEIKTRVQNLREHQRNIQEKASDKRENTIKLFLDIKEQLELAEKKALSEISRQEKKIVSQISHLIRKLDIEEDELSLKVRRLEEMCRATDPIRLLQESDITVCGHGDGEDTEEEGGQIQSEEDLDEVLISLTIHRSMRDIITNVTSQLGFHVPDILLDVDSAHRNVKLSEDLKTATRSEEEQDRTELPGRFLDYSQVLSRCDLSSGRHYWEVEWNQIAVCDIAVSYPSIEKEGDESAIGDNYKTWSLFMDDGICEALQNSTRLILNVMPTCPTLGVFLDYEAGCLSYYELCDPIRHLHTFTASFIEPLHAIFYVDDGASVTIRS
ncbi:E3 ubiquitin-protein ligase TRIM39-like [Hyla sarda]|uniref:E3 ubiquitin-protein ligase TRIM39-like n=1 Tax=Hyla sarda TaxID=327740 RepID=UPI0024C38832|nr:E3 ubiquitin-protein ligase TRIM39-like [Hyla sarda]